VKDSGRGVSLSKFGGFFYCCSTMLSLDRVVYSWTLFLCDKCRLRSSYAREECAYEGEDEGVNTMFSIGVDEIDDARTKSLYCMPGEHCFDLRELEKMVQVLNNVLGRTMRM
jgi:hypothetical protein